MLLLSAAFPPPNAQAQDTAAPTLCFDYTDTPSMRVPQDPLQAGNSQVDDEGCPYGRPPVPNYYEGNPIVFRLHDTANQRPWIRVVCVTTCHEVADSEGSPHRYYARWDPPTDASGAQNPGYRLMFPRDFTQTGPDGSGRDARTDQVPRYNSSWEAAALFPSGEVRRTFNVWAMSIFRGADITVHPGERHEVHSTGWEQSATIDMRIERLTSSGSYVPVPIPASEPTPKKPDVFGDAIWFWSVPKDEAVRIADCPPGHALDCYRLVIKGSSTSKEDEIVYFRVRPADVRVTQLAGPPPGQDHPIERTQSVTVGVDLHYPGGTFYNGPGFFPADLPPDPTGTTSGLRVRVEKRNFTSPTPIQVAEVPMVYVANRFRWEATWTVARDLAIEAGANYTLRLVEARDLWGNRVPPTPLGSFTVSAARLPAVVVQNITSIERTQEGVLKLSIKYHNGTPFSDQDNLTPLRGCFAPDSGSTPVCPQPNQPPSEAKYEDGLWVFRVRYARDYANLGTHRFVLLGGNDARDRWNNTVNTTTSAPFEVRAASPIVEFTTVMRGRTVTELERGERVGIFAIIHYHDGAPFNHTVRYAPESPWASVLNVTVTRRGENDAIQGADIIQLTEIDTERGLWVGGMDLPLDASATPIGRWSFALRVNDTVVPIPNVNDTSFDRNVLPAPIRFQQTRLSPVTPFSNSNVLFEFQLRYPGTLTSPGIEVPPDAIRSTMTAQVHRWDAKNRTAYGDPLSGQLQPVFQSERRVWSLQYVVPGNLFNGSYVFVVRGADSSGNTLSRDAWSSPFSPQSRVVERQVLTPPPDRVQRGASATVVFAAHDGDTGMDGTGQPIILVERWDAGGNRWDVVVGGTDVRAASVDVRDHFGVFKVTTTTAVGTYRFVLLGREAAPAYTLISAYSPNFTVEPTDVTRAIFQPPAELVTKGDLVWFTLERQEGDRILIVQLLHNGRVISLPQPLLNVEGDHINGTWRVPFEAPNGNYTIHIEGQDVYGNILTIDTTNIETVAAQLTGKIIGQPPRVVKRGSDATMLFGITYPSGQFYNALEEPTVLLFNDTGLVATAEVIRNGLTFEAKWTATAITSVADYWFEVNGQGIGGNSFPNLRSSTFRLAPGTFERDGTNDVPVGTERMTTNTWGIPYDGGDRFVSFQLAYYGQTADIAAVQEKEPLSVTPLPHSVDQVAGRYVARFVSDQQTPIGAYRIFAQGEDRVGNSIVGASNVFLVRPTIVVIQWEDQPVNDAFVEGATIELTFAARYKSGTPMDDNLGRPSIALLLDGQPTTQKPDLRYLNGRWIVTWTAPDLLKDGEYTFAVGGSDLHGNAIANSKSVPYLVETPISNSFAKVIPGAEPAFALLAIAALALVLSKKRRAQ